MNELKILLIGCGKMGSSLLEGIVKSDNFDGLGYKAFAPYLIANLAIFSESVETKTFENKFDFLAVVIE